MRGSASRTLGKVVDRSVVLEQEERVERTVFPGGLCAVQISARFSTGVKLFHPLLRNFFQFADLAELDRLGRASLRTSGNQVVFLAVVAQRAFMRPAIVMIPGNHPERAPD